MSVNPKLLRRTAPFSDLPVGDLRALAEAATMGWIDRGDDLFRQGDAARFVYVVFDGAVKLSRTTAPGKVMVVDFRGPAQLIAGRAAVGQFTHTDDARAIEDALVAAIPVERAAELLAVRPAATMALARHLATRLERGERRIAALSTKRVHQRLADGLLELGATLGVHSDGHTVINARLTQAEIADWIGTTRETASTLLNNLRRASHIDIVGRRIHLLNPSAIRGYAALEEPPADLATLTEIPGTAEKRSELAKPA